MDRIYPLYHIYDEQNIFITSVPDEEHAKDFAIIVHGHYAKSDFPIIRIRHLTLVAHNR